MRQLLPFGLFAAVLAAAVPVGADDDSDDRRRNRVVVARDHGPHHVRKVRVDTRPVRVDTRPVRVVYDRPGPRPVYRRAAHDLRRNHFDQRQDLEQIRSIARRWERAITYRNYPAMRTADARLDAWLDREIRESRRALHGERYGQRVRALRDELAYLERRRHRGHGHAKHYARGNGARFTGHHGYGHPRQRAVYLDEKARILDQLVRMSERQVQRAEANFNRAVSWTYAYR